MSSHQSLGRKRGGTEVVVFQPDFICPTCGMQCEDAHDILNHFDECHKSNLFFCPFQFLLFLLCLAPVPLHCMNGFRTRAQRREHVLNSHCSWLKIFHDSSSGKYRSCCVPGCNDINEPCPIDYFLRHLDERHNPDHKPNYVCPVCNRHYSRAENRKDHMKSNHGWPFSRRAHGPKPGATIINGALSDSNTFADSGMGRSYSSRHSAPQFSSYESTVASSTSLTDSFTTSPDTPFAKALQSMPRLGSQERWLRNSQQPPWNQYQCRPTPEAQIIQGSQVADQSGTAVPPQTATRIDSEGNPLADSSLPYPIAISQQQRHQQVRSNYSMQSQTQAQAIENTQQIQLEAETLFIDLARRSFEAMTIHTGACVLPEGQEDYYRHYLVNLAFFGLADELGFTIQGMQPPS